VPTVLANGIELYYEEFGSGEPLLLVMGWGGNAAAWKPQIPGLAEHFRVIAFDTRGVGRSSAPDTPYSSKAMAADAAGLLDALAIPSAHVFGISMGGMIAQELALRHPDRVDALILGCTSPGGSNAAGHDDLRALIDDFHETIATDGPDLEWFSEFLSHLWSDAALTKADPFLQDFIFALIRFPPTPQGLSRQADAVADHDAYDRLVHIKQRTLVLTGEDDTLINPENSEILFSRIPRAEIAAFAGLKHAFHLERPDLVNPLIIDFIDRARVANKRRTIAKSGSSPRAGLAP
jgi:pimeloyl-ACP methyl ester carboxylesterase